MNKYAINETLTMGDMHPLYRGITWVAAARGTDETRQILQYINVRRIGGEYKIAATDGKRLHLHAYDPGMIDTDFDELLTGNYEVVGKSSKHITLMRVDEQGSSFPEYDLLIPSYGHFHEDVFTIQTTSKLGIRTGILLATDFAQAACGFNCGFKKTETVAIRYQGLANHPFIIKHEIGMAIVMPMKISDEDTTDVNTSQDESSMTPAFPQFESKPTTPPEA